jgi:hypothetical protein
VITPAGPIELEGFHGDCDAKYLWCLHCERTYRPGQYRIAESDGMEFQMCPYDDCDGNVVIDAWDWEKVRVTEAGTPRYPEHPAPGASYPLYP